MRRRDITVRMATNEDGKAIGDLVKRLGWFQFSNWEIDWSDIEPYWIVAEHEGKLLGAIQVAPSKPIGRMEVLAIDPELKFGSRGKVVKSLTDTALYLLRERGAVAASALIPSSMGAWMEVAKHRGWVDIEEGSIMFRRLV